MASSGNTARSSPAASAWPRATTRRSTLPPRSPTTEPNWHRAIRNQLISQERRPVPVQREDIWPEVAASAAPVLAEVGLARLAEAWPEAMDRWRTERSLRQAVVAVMAA